MIWRLVTFSEALLAAILIASGPLSAAVVTGQVQLVQSKARAVKRNDFSGVVVWITSSSEVSSGLVRKHVQMIQKNKTFTPHILAIEIGTTVELPNLDPIFHNAFSNFDGQIFDIGLYPPGSSRSIRFTRPGIVKVFCNIHPSMSATIVVLDSRHFAVTDRSGGYSLADVPAGTYQLHFFHERATAETLDQLTRTIVVANEPCATPLTTISEAGYLPVAHKNKYGRDYPAGSDNTDPYSVSIR